MAESRRSVFANFGTQQAALQRPVPLFDMFPRQWTPCLFSHDLRKDPIGTTVAGTKVVLFRDESGHASALVDRCPHRGAQLSLGRVTGSRLECPLHGWQYDGRGDCTLVPLGGLSDAERSRVHATALPTYEQGGLIFIFTAPESGRPPPPPDVPPDLCMPTVHVARHQEVWETHWSRAMENMLDAPRVPFVHRRTIGRSLRRRLTPDSEMHVHVEPTPYGFRTVSTLDNGQSDAWVDWRRPNGIVLHLPLPGRTYRQHVYCVPVDEERTRMMLMTTRDFAVHNPIARLADAYSLRVMAGDRHVVESMRPKEIPPPAEPHGARTDRAALEFRKWYWSSMKEASPVRRLALS